MQQQILDKIAKLKNAIESESDPDVKKAYSKKIAALEAELAQAEQKVAEEEKKVAAEEKKVVSEADEKIKKLERALASETDPDVKARYQKKLDELKGNLKETKEEIKQDEKKVAEAKSEVKKALKEVKSAKAEVRKKAVKKVAEKVKERKQVQAKSKTRKKKVAAIVSDLDKLIQKNKKLKAKYTSDYKGSGKTTDLERDAKRQAKPVGYRFKGKGDYRVPTPEQIKRGLKRGTIDYEARPNRSDVFGKRKVKLKKGGNVGGSDDGQRIAKPMGLRWKDSAVEDGIISKASLYKTPTKRMAAKYPDYVYREERSDKADKKPSKKYISLKKGGGVGGSDDGQRIAKPMGLRWKDSAVEDGIISKSMLYKTPSKKMAEKYPDYVYREERKDKADKKPSSRFISLGDGGEPTGTAM